MDEKKLNEELHKQQDGGVAEMVRQAIRGGVDPRRLVICRQIKDNVVKFWIEQREKDAN